MKKSATIFLVLAAAAAFATEAAYEPTVVEAPSALLDIVDWFAGSRVVQLGGLTAVLISVISLLKALAPVVGAKLTGKAAYVLTSVVSLLGVLAAAITDGTIQGDEYSVIASAVVAVALAPFGYRVVFSQKAKNKGAVEAARTMFKKEW